MFELSKQLGQRQPPLQVLKAIRNSKHKEKLRESHRVTFVGDSVSRMVRNRASIRMDRAYKYLAVKQSTIEDTLIQLDTPTKGAIIVFIGPNQRDGLLASFALCRQLIARLNQLIDQSPRDIFMAVIPRNTGNETVMVKGKQLVISGVLRQKKKREEISTGRVRLLQTMIGAADYTLGDILHPSEAKIDEFVDELIARQIIR
jgi:hypothetical protein